MSEIPNFPTWEIVATILDWHAYGAGTVANQTFGPFGTRARAEDALVALVSRDNVCRATIRKVASDAD